MISFVAGEKLSTGDVVTIGEDGKIYRATAGKDTTHLYKVLSNNDFGGILKLLPEGLEKDGNYGQ